ncbi:hypothetical protein HNP38_002501 [Chryseobacterium defluvii]|uniref:Uncharacterized protein n=1 Tax=Chryseobacterium defluvii TaxID=160396 RepID=A0A840KGX0_9FLAO|nr:hypothetical protein [Chryseobacterium defluvii]MBB4807197.1 hypothetical protein [Chryseobacterium defluvii]
MKKLFQIIISIGILNGCTSSDSNPTKLDSNDYKSRVERVELLKKEIKSFSDIRDAEFELFNVNGFVNQRISVPGASSWDYKFAIRIDTINISKWTSGMQAIELINYDDNWTKEIIRHRKQNWITYSKPEYFIRKGENVTMLVFKKEGIIFKRVTNL